MYNAWREGCERKGKEPLCFMTDVLFGDDTPAGPGSGAFPWFFVQRKMIQECMQGIGLSLLFAWIIITLATRNWIIGLMSTFVIFVIVAMVIGFAVMMGWKLGVLESIIFV